MVSSCPTPKGPNYSGQDLTNHNFHADPPGSLRGANFQNAILKGAIFTGQDLTGASFQGADLGPSDKGPADFASATLANTCFIGATLNATSFTFARFQCTDFSNTSLLQADFGPQQSISPGDGCRTRFIGSTLDVHAIDVANWSSVDFTQASFQGVSPSSFSLTGKDIQGARLAGVDFSNIDMSGANLSGVDFTGATLLRSTLDNAALNGAKLAGANLQYASLACARFYGSPTQACPNTPVSRDLTAPVDLTQASLQYADLTNASLESAILTGANFSGARLRGTRFDNATLEPAGTIAATTLLAADLTNATFSNAHINYVQFNNVILTGAVFDKTTLAGTDFSGSIMPNASFAGATLESVNFNSAILQGASFNGASLQTVPNGGGSGVVFTCAQLGGSDFSNATITAASFQAAVMPPQQDCCTPPGLSTWCGLINITQQTYGPVTYPILQSKVTCPNGDVAACSGSQWVIPQWRTDLCNSNHTVQTVWSAPDCTSSPGDIVAFKDENLKECILASLPGTPSEVTITTAAQIPQVSCPGRGITDLTGLESFTGLVMLDLTANQLSGFNLKLQTLKTLKLADNQLTLLDVSGLPALVSLDASNNKLQSLVGIASIYPVVLDLSYNQFTTFDLPILSTLVYADLSHNQLSSVLDDYNDNLGQLTQLAYLDLSHNSLSTLGSVQSIASSDSNPEGALQSLFLDCNPSFDCSTLGLDGSYPALRTSQCATFNSQSSQWLLLQNPTCLP
jgi:uncharacterized protein YjbI with pentapeptide repeats